MSPEQFPPGLSADEQALLARARTYPGSGTLADLSPDLLRQISRQEGVDFATALLFDRVHHSFHRAFITEVDRLMAAPRAIVDPAAWLVGIVPAVFYQQMPQAGADGRVVRETAAGLGLSCELVPLLSAGTLAENARILCDWLARHRQRKIILVSLCKGGADVKYALNAPAGWAAFQPVVAWVNVCGTLSGSPFAEWLLTTKPRFIAAWVYFKCSGHNFQVLREIVPRPNGPLSAPLRLPDSLRLINLVGFPLKRHLSNAFIRRCHQFISPGGPNDGGVLLTDACQLPGSLYPVWGADHYLRPDVRARAILAAVFTYLDEEFAGSRDNTPFPAASTGGR
jgi:hypothetical protein